MSGSCGSGGLTSEYLITVTFQHKLISVLEKRSCVMEWDMDMVTNILTSTDSNNFVLLLVVVLPHFRPLQNSQDPL